MEGNPEETSSGISSSARRLSVYLGTCSFADIPKRTRLKSLEATEAEASVEEEEVERGENLEGWGLLPDLIIEKVYGYLDIQGKYLASQVCRQWQRGFYMQGSWHTFQLEDHTLTRHKFNYYMGWQLILDHLRTQVCVFRIGRFIRNLVFSPMTNLFNLYEFMNLLSYYKERYDEDITSRAPLNIRSLRFTFRCDVATRQENLIYGTGGKLLEALERLMLNLTELRNLELIDLLLDSREEAIHLLDDVCSGLCEKLGRLVLINATKNPVELLHPACFIRLRVLKISPQNISSDMIELLCNNRNLQELHIIQNDYTETAMTVDRKVWKMAKFKIFLRTFVKTDKEICWREGAPIHSIIYDSPITKVNWESIVTVIDLYASTLEEYGHLGLPKFGKRNAKTFERRADGPLLLIARKCLKLRSFYIRERISTSTILLIVSLASPCLEQLWIRRNAIILKCDYKKHRLCLSKEFEEWLVLNSRSYDKTTMEIRALFRNPNWKLLTDSEFKRISNFVKIPY